MSRVFNSSGDLFTMCASSYQNKCKVYSLCSKFRLATRVFVVAPMTFLMTQQKTRTICNPKLIAIPSRLEKIFNGSIRLKGSKIQSFHWIRETVKIEVTTVRPNVHVNIPEEFTIRECDETFFQIVSKYGFIECRRR